MPKEATDRLPPDTRAEHLSDAQVAEIRARRPGISVTLACEGLHLTDEEKALLDQMKKEGQNRQQRDQKGGRIPSGGRRRMRRSVPAPEPLPRRPRTASIRPLRCYFVKSSYTANEAKTLARHLTKTGEDPAYGTGVRMLREVGERDLEAIVQLHKEAMARYRATCLWSHAPNASRSGLAASPRP